MVLPLPAAGFFFMRAPTRIVVTAAAVLCLAALSRAASGPQDASIAPPSIVRMHPQQDGSRVDTKHLTATMSASVSAAAPGARLTLYLDVVPKPGMHVYAPGQKDVIPVALTLAPGEHVRGGAVKFPAAEKYFFAPLNETQLVYSAPFRLSIPVTITKPAAAGPPTPSPLTIKGVLRYQACDNRICYMPQDVPVSWTLPVGRAAS